MNSPCPARPGLTHGFSSPARFYLLAQKKGSKIKKVASVEEGDENMDSPGSQSRGSVPGPVCVCVSLSAGQARTEGWCGIPCSTFILNT